MWSQYAGSPHYHWLPGEEKLSKEKLQESFISRLASPFVNKILVQWPELAEAYPNTTYIGRFLWTFCRSVIPKRQHMKVAVLFSVKWMFLAEMQTFSLHVKHWSAMRVTWSLGRSHETFSWELSSVAFKYSSLSQAVLLTLTSSEYWCRLVTVATSKNQFSTVQQKQSPPNTGSGRAACINFGALVTWKEKRESIDRFTGNNTKFTVTMAEAGEVDIYRWWMKKWKLEWGGFKSF